MTTQELPARDPALQMLLDKHDICEVLARYARAADRCDVELLKTVFHEDAVDVHFGETRTFAEFSNWGFGLVGKIGNVAHYFGFPYVEIHGDVAYGETYAISFHRMNTPEGTYDSIWGARCLDRFERRAGIWKIAYRRAVYDWNRDVPAAETWNRGYFGPNIFSESRKDQSDPVYEFLRTQR